MLTHSGAGATLTIEISPQIARAAVNQYREITRHCSPAFSQGM
jgi:hypothetical protein